jgi:hypothetical protein
MGINPDTLVPTNIYQGGTYDPNAPEDSNWDTPNPSLPYYPDDSNWDTPIPGQDPNAYIDWSDYFASLNDSSYTPSNWDTPIPPPDEDPLAYLD